jgi:hypothetical protein
VYESEKIRVDQVSEKVHPPVMIGARSNSCDPAVETNLLCSVGKPRSINPSLVFINLYYTLSLVRCALSD